MVPGGPIRSLHPQRPRGVRASGECPRRTVLALLEDHAQHHPLNRALVMLDGEHARAITYVELVQRVREVATWLSARFPDGGECVAIAVLAPISREINWLQHFEKIWHLVFGGRIVEGSSIPTPTADNRQPGSVSPTSQESAR